MEGPLISGLNETVAEVPKIKRDNDSVDDFEHLDSLVKGDVVLSPVPRALREVDSGVSSSLDGSGGSSIILSPSLIDNTATASADDYSDTAKYQPKHIEQPPVQPKVMDANFMDHLIESDDSLFRKKEDEVMGNKQEEIFNGLTNASQTLLDYERNFMQEPKIIQPSFNDLADKFTDSDPDIDDDHMYDDENKAKFASADDLLRADSPTAGLPVDQFKDVINEAENDYEDVIQPTKLERKSPSPVLADIPTQVSSAFVPADSGITLEEFVISSTKDYLSERKEPVREFLPEDDHTPDNSSPVKQAAPVIKATVPEVSKVAPIASKNKPGKPEVGIMQAEEMFLKMGLDTWFNPERLHPTVESLIYWRDPKKSGAVFGSILVVLLSLAYFSLISVTAYLSLFVLIGTISFRIYKTVMQAVQKTSDGHPFKEILELDLTLPQDKVNEITELVVTHINGAVNELRRLFLVEDLIDSIKFGVALWTLTYLGAWFNGMTLIIIGFVALFTLPKVYETNKTQIDANLDIVRTKLAEITSKVKAAVPIGKKSEEKKD